MYKEVRVQRNPKCAEVILTVKISYIWLKEGLHFLLYIFISNTFVSTKVPCV